MPGLVMPADRNRTCLHGADSPICTCSYSYGSARNSSAQRASNGGDVGGLAAAEVTRIGTSWCFAAAEGRGQGGLRRKEQKANNANESENQRIAKRRPPFPCAAARQEA